MTAPDQDLVVAVASRSSTRAGRVRSSTLPPSWAWPTCWQMAPSQADALAAELGADEPFLHRLLLMLVSLDICTVDDDGRFGLAPMGELLSAGVQGSVRAWTLYWGGSLWPVLGQLR